MALQMRSSAAHSAPTKPGVTPPRPTDGLGPCPMSRIGSSLLLLAKRQVLLAVVTSRGPDSSLAALRLHRGGVVRRGCSAGHKVPAMDESLLERTVSMALENVD